jgi:hypothetical protein
MLDTPMTRLAFCEASLTINTSSVYRDLYHQIHQQKEYIADAVNVEFPMPWIFLCAGL